MASARHLSDSQELQKNFSNKKTLNISEVELKEVISAELIQLNQLYDRDTIEKKLSNSDYQVNCVKKCEHCNKVYKDREQFLKETTYIPGHSLVFEQGGIQEIRRCSCGAKINMWQKGADRRDGSYLGCLKRILYSNCVNKLIHHYKLDPYKDYEYIKSIKHRLRFYFKKII